MYLITEITEIYNKKKKNNNKLATVKNGSSSFQTSSWDHTMVKYLGFSMVKNLKHGLTASCLNRKLALNGKSLRARWNYTHKVKRLSKEKVNPIQRGNELKVAERTLDGRGNFHEAELVAQSGSSGWRFLATTPRRASPTPAIGMAVAHVHIYSSYDTKLVNNAHVTHNLFLLAPVTNG